MDLKKALAAVIIASVIASGQTSPRPKFDRFEVATIKLTGPQPGGRWIKMLSVDRFEARNHAVRTLIAAAYEMSPDAISGNRLISSIRPASSPRPCKAAVRSFVQQ